MIRKTIKLCVVASASLTAGCGNDMIDLSCDKPALYQQAVEGRKLVVPDGLDDLNPARAMPVPDAAAAKPRVAGEPCLDIPPRYLEDAGLPTGPKKESKEEDKEEQ